MIVGKTKIYNYSLLKFGNYFFCNYLTYVNFVLNTLIIVEEPDDILNSLKERTKQMMTLCDGLKEEKKNLLTTNRELVQKVAQQDKEIDNIKKKFETLKIAKTVLGTDNDVHETKLRVNRIVREIDKCIALLNK
ncbi:MAG: hypothetical protein IMY71_11795 [Bacteroidetes bacterium]|nr:hypothetical protein [Bacteroidota bacterium]